MTKEQLLEKLNALEAEAEEIRQQLRTISRSTIEAGKFYQWEDTIFKVNGFNDEGDIMADLAYADRIGVWFDMTWPVSISIDWEETNKEKWDEIIQQIKDRL